MLTNATLIAWHPKYKPSVRQPTSTAGTKRGRIPSTYHREYPSPVTAADVDTAETTTEPASNIEPPATSVKPSASTLLKTPKPDVTLGLDPLVLQTSLNLPFALTDLEATGVPTDPGQTPLGLHLPFLVVEAKNATSSCIYAAQNQAAVDAACALNILQSVTAAAAAFARVETTHSSSQVQAQAQAHTIPELCFSITSEGPIVELWMHVLRPSDPARKYVMANLNYARLSDAGGTQELVKDIAAILHWGETKIWHRLTGLCESSVGGFG